MSDSTNQVLNRFYFNLGRELQRVRLSKNLTIEQAAEQLGFKKPKVLCKLEEGRFFSVYTYLRLVHSYKQNLVIRLEDEL